ncbi:hypothetical protein [Pseudonocardia kunmingensis]|uniref:Uncharacterized protein n=1 Tax=Pseudonocardia kunmingensis TaxID=630975 RepID=A0A543DP68_9PSEU|nr:hypothetical protein [Pseudonocardia kunmingensis]TQM11127.1 hypothetical protein FB558_3676 [Pseudonocardia kunmingensis]
MQEIPLDEIRARGYSSVMAEGIPGMTSVAAPAQPTDVPVTAALQVPPAAQIGLALAVNPALGASPCSTSGNW